jgi:hypothetical protein
VPLTSAQKATLAEITRESYASVDAKSAGLNEDVVTLLAADVTRWGTVRSKHLKVKGGRDGVDLDYSREREEIRRRDRNLLGFPLYSEEELGFATDAMQMVEVDVGDSFG